MEYTYYVDRDSRDLRFNPSGMTEYHYNDPLLRFLRSSRKEPLVEVPAEQNSDPGPPMEPSVAESYNRTPDDTVRFEWKMDEVPKECISCSGKY